MLICDDDRNEIKSTNAFRYIKWGESQTDKNGRHWNEVPTVSARERWYSIGDKEPGDILLNRSTGDNHRSILNIDHVQVDDDFFELKIQDASLFNIFLNSCFFFLQKELIGRANLGDGALKVDGPDWKRILVPNKKLLQSIIKECKTSFNKLCKRKIYSIIEESKRKDRIEFEQSVLKAIGLNASDAESILRGIVELVEERHLLPKLRKTKKKKRIERDTDKLCDEVAEEIFSEGRSMFPEVFVKNWGRLKCEEIEIPAGIIKLGESFFGKQEICDEDGKHVFEVPTIEKGKFLVYAKKRDEQIVKLPLNETVLVKSVQDYEHYLIELKNKFIHAFIDQCGDRILAENLTRKVFEDYNLPYI